MRNFVYFSLVCCCVMVSACNENRKAKNYNGKSLVDDQAMNFLKEAHESGMVEMQASELAQSKAGNARVVSFAKMMTTDHEALGKDIKHLADQKYVTVRDTITTEHKMAIDSLTKLSGADFDRFYMQLMVKDHEKAVDLFKGSSRNMDVSINKITKKNIPLLTAHLDSAKAILSSLK